MFLKRSDRIGQNYFINLVVALVSPSRDEVRSEVATFFVANKLQEFPENFSFGTSTSAVQVEGAWNEDGKSPSTWDNRCHDHPELVANGTNADVATDSYHLFRDDIKAVNSVGVTNYLIMPFN